VGKRGIGVLVAVAVGLAACSGSSKAASSSASTVADSSSSTNPVVTTTTARPGPTTTRPEYSFDDSVPPPKLLNTGTDYVAILESLESYGSWLAGHHPDPVLSIRINAPGTRLHDAFARDLTRLRDNGTRLIETLRGPSKYTILSIRPDAFSARLVQNIVVDRTVVAGGRVTSERHFSGSTTYLMLAVASGGHWYLSAVDEQTE
jgi:hypothetical protein